jgi:hypothetical protein
MFADLEQMPWTQHQAGNPTIGCGFCGAGRYGFVFTAEKTAEVPDKIPKNTNRLRETLELQGENTV